MLGGDVVEEGCHGLQVSCELSQLKYMNDDQPNDDIFTDQKTGVQLNDNVFF